MIHLTRNPVELPAFRLETPTDMFDALSELNSQGWRGQISADETGAYYLEANTDGPTRQITAHIGDVLVDDLGWRLLSGAQADANYEEV